MSSQRKCGPKGMITPRVTEIVRAPEPVNHDDFVDDLRPQASAAASASSRVE